MVLSSNIDAFKPLFSQNDPSEMFDRVLNTIAFKIKLAITP